MADPATLIVQILAVLLVALLVLRLAVGRVSVRVPSRPRPRRIAVIGVGGAGSNAVDAMVRAKIRASDFIARLADDRVGMILTETDEIEAINMIERLRDSGDRALAARAVGGRLAFGWASASASTSLFDAVVRADELLRNDAGSG
ncbi:MAG: hypothetical protein A2V84_11740 [Chloroflexi bacterium RBG_16_70_13]|nr:MAG: hypothetical protein A2V84_11740 [Chloroflexi bacterium RBG_16_70_13]